MELQALVEHRVHGVLLLFEKGLRREDITSYFAGTVEHQEGRWEWDEYGAFDMLEVSGHICDCLYSGGEENVPRNQKDEEIERKPR
jgi:hypothetical protein